MTGGRILVTGSDGFLGRSVVHRLRASGHVVFPVTRRAVADDPAVRCDLGSSEEARSMLLAVRPEVIVNLAAEVDLSEHPGTGMFSVNALFPVLAADYARTVGVHLVQSSTIAVHGAGHRIVGEGTPIAPDTQYGMSKAIADAGIRASGCRAAIIRFGGIFGPDGPWHLHLNSQLAEASEGRAPTLMGQGSALRNYIYVEDAARTVEHCVEARLEGTYYAGGEALSFRDMLGAISHEWLAGLPIHPGAGPDGSDRLIEISVALPAPRPFTEAMHDMRVRQAVTGVTPC